MLTSTLSEGLERYEIGPKLRALRLKRKMGLVELGKHTGLSPAMLSKIERGRLFPTLPTLLRIALVFSVDLGHFFVGPREAPVVAVVRRKERQRFPERPGGRKVAYHFESLDFPASSRRMDGYLVEFEAVPDQALTPHDHPGAELMYVIEGQVRLRFSDDEAYALGAGDSVYFDSSRPHAYQRIGSKRCTAVVVTSG